MVGFFLRQFPEHYIHRVLKSLIILSDLHRVDELDQCGEVLLLDRGFIVDIADQRRIEQRLGFYPKIVPCLALALGVGDQRRDKLQNILFALDVGKRVIVHGLREVDRVEDLDLIPIVQQHLSALGHDAALVNCF